MTLSFEARVATVSGRVFLMFCILLNHETLLNSLINMYVYVLAISFKDFLFLRNNVFVQSHSVA